jgi:carboxymethylenebutenolidase
LPTIYGVNPFTRRYANGLAEVGLTAAVCDLYSGQPPVADYEEAVKRARTLSDAPVENIVGNWLDHLQADRQLTSLGILGFCLGGRYALLRAAHDHHIKACAAAYPSIPDPMLANQQQDVLRLAAQIRCPVHICQPGQDNVTSEKTYHTLKETLLRRTAATVVQYYPEAEHGFMGREQPPANPVATAIASPQMITFLAACLN